MISLSSSLRKFIQYTNIYFKSESKIELKATVEILLIFLFASTLEK